MKIKTDDPIVQAAIISGVIGGVFLVIAAFVAGILNRPVASAGSSSNVPAPVFTETLPATSTVTLTSMLFSPIASETPTLTLTFIPNLTDTSMPEAIATEAMRLEKYLYVANEGDSFTSISVMFFEDQSYGEAIRRANCTEKLLVGDSVTIKVYTVHEGDSVTAIATRFNVGVNDILYVNQLSTGLLYVDQKLIIPNYGQCDLNQ